MVPNKAMHPTANVSVFLYNTKFIKRLRRVIASLLGSAYHLTNQTRGGKMKQCEFVVTLVMELKKMVQATHLMAAINLLH